MPKAQTYHVVPHEGAWAVKKSGGSVRVFETKGAAIDDARKRARGQNHETQVVVHGKAGQIIQNTSMKSDISEKALRDAVRSIDRTKRGPTTPIKSTRVMGAKKR